MSDLSKRITSLLKRGVEYRAARALADTVVVVGSSDAPVTSASTDRPEALVAYWVCSAGVTPTKAKPSDMIFNLAG